MTTESKVRVVIVGAGFGGLTAARKLTGAQVAITLIDRRNYHTFQPLLYQVATAGLSPAEIAAPIRWVLRRQPNLEVLLGEVEDFDVERRFVKLPDLELPYDYLVVATGASHAYFGHEEWEPFAPGLKTIEDALEIRRRSLLAFELAERQAAAGEPPLPLNFIIVGGGPTGVELAGTLAEISRHVLAHEFRSISPRTTRIVLLEGGPRILPAYSSDLSRSAQEQLCRLGVEVRTSALVTKIEPAAVWIGQTRLDAAVILWAAGVSASPLGRRLGAPVDRAGRVLVSPDLSVPGHPEIFVIGDLASLRDESGQVLPGLARVAIEQGEAVARNIERDRSGKLRQNFHYLDWGSLATIGRAAAVAQFGRVRISGFPAWLAWLFVHIYFLIGFRNRLIVLIQWAWSYLTYERGARLITGDQSLPSWEQLRSNGESPASKRGSLSAS